MTRFSLFSRSKASFGRNVIALLALSLLCPFQSLAELPQQSREDVEQALSDGRLEDARYLSHGLKEPKEILGIVGDFLDERGTIGFDERHNLELMLLFAAKHGIKSRLLDRTQQMYRGPISSYNEKTARALNNYSIDYRRDDVDEVADFMASLAMNISNHPLRLSLVEKIIDSGNLEAARKLLDSVTVQSDEKQRLSKKLLFEEQQKQKNKPLLRRFFIPGVADVDNDPGKRKCNHENCS